MKTPERREVERLEELAVHMFDGPCAVPGSYIDQMAEKLVEARLKAIKSELAQSKV